MIAKFYFQQLRKNEHGGLQSDTYAGMVKRFEFIMDWFEYCDLLRTKYEKVLQAIDGQTFIITNERIDL